MYLNVSNDIIKCIGVCLTFNNTTINIVGIYRSPSGGIENIIVKNNLFKIFMRDFNICLLKDFSNSPCFPLQT